MSHTQTSLFDLLPVVPPSGHVGPRPEPTIEEAFWRFHGDNPHVYAELVMLARRWRRRSPGRRCGIKMLFEVLRWRSGMRTAGDEFLLNNNYHSYYARLIMVSEADLAGIFELRALHARAPQQ